VGDNRAVHPYIHMDAMAFGMGACCLQTTYQARDIAESRALYDQLAVLAPLLVLTIYYGVQPGPILEACNASVTLLVKNFDTALAVTKTAALALH
jgi:NADH:ubiquinone oxidoreductase subunit 4 (subunit M)